jgi:uncharacterized protein YbjT (DUF2867 family)
LILVTGGSGNVGTEVVQQLAAGPEPVRVLLRDVAKGTAFAPNVATATGDLSAPSSLRDALAGVRAVFLLGGFPDMRGILSELRRASVERVVLLSSRSVTLADPSNAVVKMWLESEASVQKSGISWTMLRPSGFASNALRWLPQLRAGDVVRAPFANAAIASIDPADIAAAAVVSLTTEGHAGQSYALSGPEAQLPALQVQILAEVLGRELKFEAVPDEEALAALKQSSPPGFAEAFYRFFVEGEFDDAVVVPTIQELTGRAPSSFKAWAVRNAAAFR